MNKELIIGFILTFLFTLASVSSSDTSAPTPYPVYGAITINGESINAMSISLTNLKTGEVLDRMVFNGEFVGDLSEFRQGASTGNDYRITYCIDDSRCDELSETFTPTGSGKDISKDLVVSNKGLYGPYSVYGKVRRDGVLLEDVDVVLENLEKGYSKEIETNNVGEFVWNLANWGVYDTGDRIRATYEDHSVTGYVSGGGLSLDINIITGAEVPGEGGGGREDDGGGGGVTKPDEKEEEPEEPGVEPEEPGEPTIPHIEEVDVDGKTALIIVIFLIIIMSIVYWYFKFYKK